MRHQIVGVWQGDWSVGGLTGSLQLQQRGHWQLSRGTAALVPSPPGGEYFGCFNKVLSQVVGKRLTLAEVTGKVADRPPKGKLI
jgi:hypothetical protein